MRACQPKASKFSYSRYPAFYSLYLFSSFPKKRSREAENTRHSSLWPSPITENSAPFHILAFALHRQLCAFPHLRVCSSQASLFCSSLLLLLFTALHSRQLCGLPHPCFCPSQAILCLPSLMSVPFTGNSVPFLTLAFAHHRQFCAFCHSCFCPSQGGGQGS